MSWCNQDRFAPRRATEVCQGTFRSVKTSARRGLFRHIRRVAPVRLQVLRAILSFDNICWGPFPVPLVSEQNTVLQPVTDDVGDVPV